MGVLKVKPLSAAVRVVQLDTDGKPMLRVNGVDEAGKPKTEPVVQIRFLDRGAELPANLADGEAQRLQDIDAVGPADEVDAYIRRLTDPGAVAEEEHEAADARLALVRAPDPGASLAAMTDDQLVAWIESEKPTVPELVEAVGDDPVLARRVLSAEDTTTGGDPRSTLVEQLEKIAER